jgi:flagellar protein FlgJ
MTSAINSPASVSDSQKTNPVLVGAAKPTQASKVDKSESKRLEDASRQFEAVLLRQMLSSLERTTSTQAGKDAGSNLYGSMVVDAVADAISQAGGLGLASMLKRTLEPQLTQQAAVKTEPTKAGSNAEKAGKDRATKAPEPGGGGST